MTKSLPSVTIVRRVKASPAKVWKAITEPRLMMQWWGPDAGPTLRAEADVRPGGRFSVVFRLLNGEEHNPTVIGRTWSPASTAASQDSSHPSDHRRASGGACPTAAWPCRGRFRAAKHKQVDRRLVIEIGARQAADRVCAPVGFRLGRQTTTAGRRTTAATR